MDTFYVVKDTRKIMLLTSIFPLGIGYLKLIVWCVGRCPSDLLPLKWQPPHKSKSIHSRHLYFSQGSSAAHSLHVATYPLHVSHLDMKRVISRMTSNDSYCWCWHQIVDVTFLISFKYLLCRLYIVISFSSSVLTLWCEFLTWDSVNGRTSERELRIVFLWCCFFAV